MQCPGAWPETLQLGLALSYVPNCVFLLHMYRFSTHRETQQPDYGKQDAVSSHCHSSAREHQISASLDHIILEHLFFKMLLTTGIVAQL